MAQKPTNLVLTKYNPPSLFLTTQPSNSHKNRKWQSQARAIQSFLEAVADGMPTKYACGDSGLNYSSVSQWLNPNLPNYDPKFLELYEKAIAVAVRRNIKRINASRDWKAAAFWLERSTHEFHPKSTQMNLSANGQASSDDSAERLKLSPTMMTKLSAAHDRMIAKLKEDKPDTK